MSREHTEKFREMIDKNSFALHNHVRITDVEENGADGELTVTPDQTNSFGMVHGGSLFALADCVAGMAARGNGEIYVTQTADLHFLGNTKETRIFCHCSVLKRTRSTALVEGRVTDPQGKLLFLADFTFFNVTGRVKLKD